MIGAVLAGILIPVGPTSPLAQKPRCEDLCGMIRATYDFRPSQLPESRKASKSKDIDRIWDLVKAHPDELVPCLRKELEKKDANRWFLHDGSDLLVRVEKSRDHKRLQVRLWSQDDLDDIDPGDWVKTLVARGIEGFDVSTAADRWLLDLDARRFTPAHGLDYEPMNVPLFLFGSMKESDALPHLVRIVETPEHRGQAIAIQVLSLLATPESLEQLERIQESHPSGDVRSRISAFFEDPPLVETAKVGEGPDRNLVRRALLSYLSLESDLYFELKASCEHGWARACARVLQPEDAWLVRKVRRQSVRIPDKSSAADYLDYSRVLLTLTWDPKRAK